VSSGPVMSPCVSDPRYFYFSPFTDGSKLPLYLVTSRSHSGAPQQILSTGVFSVRDIGIY
jgi:hypothetical protein